MENKLHDLRRTRIKNYDWFVNRFIREYEKGDLGERFCFILGSGASKKSGIPTGAELEMRWMNYMMGVEDDYPNKKHLPLEVYRKKTPEQTEELVEAMKAEGQLKYDFAEISANWEECRKGNGKPMESEYYFDINNLRFEMIKKDSYRYTEQLMQGSEPSIGYYPLAWILAESRNNLVITTNFDTLVEDALFIYTKEKPLVAGHEALAGYIDAKIQRPMIAKVHRGLFTAPMNDPESTSELKEQWKKTLSDALKIYTPVVIGYGGGDSSLMDFLQSEAELKNGIYWCVYKDELPPAAVRQFLNKTSDGFMIKTNGFDSIMLALGRAIAPDRMEPAAVKKLLEDNFTERYKNYEEQLRELDKADPVQKDLDESVRAGEAEREREDKLTADDWLRRGNRAYDEGETEKAIADYTKAIELKPDYADAYYNRGVAYRQSGEMEKAIADYTKAIELKPDYAEAYNNRGVAYRQSGETEKAIADYTKAIELKPDYAKAYNNRGVAYGQSGETEKAIADYTKAIELKPYDADAYNNRGVAYRQSGETEKAIADYTKAIELKPDYVDAYYNRGNAYYVLSETAKAIADYTKAIELKPDYAKAYYNRGIAYGKMGETEKAKADREKAKQLDPTLE